jgi:DnaJ-domain-containing protein 1
MPAPKKPTGSMSWLEYAFGLASRAAQKTWGEVREEYKAGREGKPSPNEAKRRVPAPSPRPSGPPWWEVLRVPRGASLKEVAMAYRDLIRQNHPDKVAHLSEKIRRVADEETRRINEAYAEAQRLLGNKQ